MCDMGRSGHKMYGGEVNTEGWVRGRGNSIMEAWGRGYSTMKAGGRGLLDF